MERYDRYGWLELEEPIIKYDGKRKRKYWKCWCSHCANWCEVREDAIKSGQKTCGCLSKGFRRKWLYQKHCL